MTRRSSTLSAAASGTSKVTSGVENKRDDFGREFMAAQGTPDAAEMCERCREGLPPRLQFIVDLA
jgi:hypothetical protein